MERSKTKSFCSGTRELPAHIQSAHKQHITFCKVAGRILQHKFKSVRLSETGHRKSGTGRIHTFNAESRSSRRKSPVFGHTEKTMEQGESHRKIRNGFHTLTSVPPVIFQLLQELFQTAFFRHLLQRGTKWLDYLESSPMWHCTFAQVLLQVLFSDPCIR